MSRMCTMPCMPTLTETMSLSRDLPSNFFEHPQFFFLILLICLDKWNSFIKFMMTNRFFKESSTEEREHAEKLMEYQVYISYIVFRNFRYAHFVLCFELCIQAGFVVDFDI